MIRNLGLAVSLLLMTFAGGGAFAEQARPFNEMRLTEKMVVSFIRCQKGLQAIALENRDGRTDVTPKLEMVARKNGFKNFKELDDVAANISVILSGIDRNTGIYTDLHDQILQEIESAKRDPSLSDSEREVVLAELKESLTATPRYRFPENAKVIAKYYAEIMRALQ